MAITNTTNPQPTQLTIPKHSVWYYLVLLVVCVVVSSGGTYMYVNSEHAQKEAMFEQALETNKVKIDTLQQKLASKNSTLNNTSPEVHTSGANPVSNTAQPEGAPVAPDHKSPLTKTSTNGYLVSYSGKVVVSGYYQLEKEGLLAKTLCFYTDNKTAYLIPREENVPELGKDQRPAWFCFSNYDAALKLLQVTATKGYNDPAVSCIQGNAQVEISNYTANRRESEVYDTATLEKVLQNNVGTQACEY